MPYMENGKNDDRFSWENAKNVQVEKHDLDKKYLYGK